MVVDSEEDARLLCVRSRANLGPRKNIPAAPAFLHSHRCPIFQVPRCSVLAPEPAAFSTD